MQLPASALELRDGAVRAKNDAERAVTLAELARLLRGGPGYGFPPGFTPGLEALAAFRSDHMAYANACHAAEVEVDIETGEVHILRYVALHDHGAQINPMIVDGQTRGGIAHGIGNALYEWMGYDGAGQPVTTTFRRLSSARRDGNSRGRILLHFFALAGESARRKRRR